MNLIALINTLGHRPGDDVDLRLRKTTLTWAAVAGLAVGLFFLILSWLAFEPVFVMANGLVILALGALLVGFAITGREGLLIKGTLLVLLVLPIALTHSQAGILDSAPGLLVWGMLPALLGVVLVDRRTAWTLLGLYIAGVTWLVATAPLWSGSTARPNDLVLRIALGTNTIFVAVFSVLVVGHLARRRQEVTAELGVAHQRSESLLLNVLPGPIAERLKLNPGVIADRFEEATILFADIVGFTPLSARVSPEQLVLILDELFSAFDSLAAKHGLEKIKTIGDAYMVAGGIPTPRADHAEAVADMALGMLRAVAEYRERTGEPLEVRIGVNTGPVVAGVIGKHRFIYDLWGDAVNVASRLESHGVAGSVQIGPMTRSKLLGAFELESRGTISLKGRGDLETWLVLGRSRV